MALNPRQRAFVAAYAGDGAAAARAAGYAPGVAKTTAYKLLRHPEIAVAIRSKDEAMIAAATARAPDVLTRQERQKFLSDVIRDVDAEMKDRLKALELLGRSEGDFLERVEHSGALTLEQLVAESAKR